MRELRRAWGVVLGVLQGLWALGRSGAGPAYFSRLRHVYEMTLLNLYLCLPERRSERVLRRTARRVLWNRLYNDMDFSGLLWEPFEAQGLEHLAAALDAGRGAIVCTQHVGPYRRVFLELLRRGHAVNLLAAQHVVRSVQAQFRRRGLAPELRERLRLLNAHQPGITRSMLEALRRGELLLVYLDGNTGLGGPGETAAAHANTVALRFLGQTVAVRRGVCQIAHASGAPLVPLVAHWGPRRRPALTLLPALWPDRSLTPAEFCEQGLRRLFAHCEQAVRARPEQFEEWPSLRRWRCGVAEDAAEAPAVTVPELAAPAQARLRVDPQRARLLAVGGRRVLADALRGRALRIEPWTAAVMSAWRRPHSVAELRRRLRRRYDGARVAEAAERLWRLGFVEQVGP